MNSKTNKLIKISLLSAISLVLMYFDFPVIPIFPWLKVDLSDVPALLGAFGFGPLVGVAIELVKNLLYFFIKGSSIAGVMANFIVGSALILPAGFIYHKKKSKKTAILGMIIGAVIMEIAGIFANIYILLPLYGMSMSSAELTQYVTVGLLPFNGVKALMVSVLTYFLYKRVSVSIFKAEPNFGSPINNRIS
ncbi:ECF transporter S component [uncultured Clostridium sp.]|uniref:ECF transporter S component n=1 Tax=uncultured Clostridium sp. TaxID=59620 RepID=UPI0025FFEC87|nr:ECF transporter S component [uncultured Clostridium sp.]